jgi:hypothetical protein
VQARVGVRLVGERDVHQADGAVGHHGAWALDGAAQTAKPVMRGRPYI